MARAAAGRGAAIKDESRRVFSCSAVGGDQRRVALRLLVLSGRLPRRWYDALPDDDAPPRPASSSLAPPDRVPVVRDGALSVRVLCGSYKGQAGPVVAALSLVILHGRLEAGTATLGPLPPGHNGFLWVLDGALEAGGVALSHGDRGLGLLPPGGDALRLTATAPCEFFVALGPPRRVAHYKYVGAAPASTPRSGGSRRRRGR